MHENHVYLFLRKKSLDIKHKALINYKKRIFIYCDHTINIVMNTDILPEKIKHKKQSKM